MVFSRIREALAWHQSIQEGLTTLPQMRSLLDAYDAAIRHTQKIMRDTGAAAACSRCAAERGSCCFQEVETWYDPMLLFINLLLNVDLPKSRRHPNQCLFLGPEGCRLRARYSFCLNYFCPTLQEQMDPDLMHAVRRAVGRELLAGWELERFLYRWLNGQSEA